MLLETKNAEAAGLCILTHSEPHSHFLVASIIQVNVRTVLAHGWLIACRVVPGADMATGLSSQATYTPNTSCIPWTRKVHAIYADLVDQCQLRIFSVQEHCLVSQPNPEDVCCVNFWVRVLCSTVGWLRKHSMFDRQKERSHTRKRQKGGQEVQEDKVGKECDGQS